MAKERIKTRTPVEGQLDPDLWYSAADLMRSAGIGRNTLIELRQSGKLKAHRLCGQGRNWYRGSDVLALMEPVEQVKLARR